MRKNHTLDSIDGPTLEHIINIFENDPVSVEDELEDFSDEQRKAIMKILFK